MFQVPYKARRGHHEGFDYHYTYYKARIRRDGRTYYLGHFQSAKEAMAAYLQAKTNEGGPMTEKLGDHLAYPPRALRAERAAAYLSMSTSQFLKLVDEGKLPKPKRLGGIVFWDRVKLDEFVEYFEGDDGAESGNPFEKVMGNV